MFGPRMYHRDFAGRAERCRPLSTPQTNVLLCSSRAMTNLMLKVVLHKSSTEVFCLFLYLKKTKPNRQKITAANVNFKTSKANILVTEGAQAASVPGTNVVQPHNVIDQVFQLR